MTTVLLFLFLTSDNNPNTSIYAGSATTSASSSSIDIVL